jgi:hypothetical protein
MRAILSVLVAVTLFVPRAAAASEILFRISDGGELAFDFGQQPVEISGPFTEVAIDGLVCCGAIDGSVDILSGPLLDLTVFPDGCGADPPCESSVYSYGPGTLSIDAQFELPDGSVGTGGFAGTILDFTISVCEGCDYLFGGSLADDIVINLGSGLFDPAFAWFLGVSGSTSGGTFVIGPEGITGDSTSRVRTGFSHSGYADLVVTTVTPVPEPGTMALSIVAVAAFSARRRRARIPAHS